MSKSSSEQEYFARQEARKLAEMKEQLLEEAASKAKIERAALHHNKCGKCGADMKPRIFKGVEIDVCVECAAVLLDPGELQMLAGDDDDGVVLTTLKELFHFTRE